MYEIAEVDGLANRNVINYFNSLCPETFPELEPRHFHGHWWIAYHETGPVAFAGLVPMEPFPNVGYLKRCYVSPAHHGHGLQYRLMVLREIKAKQLGWKMLVSECAAENEYSASNFRKAGFKQCNPEQKWGAPNSVYWRKLL